MKGYIISQVILCLILMAAGLLACWWYHAKIGRVMKLTALQYRFFALRDQAVMLVADGKISEDDPRWQWLYQHLNESTKVVKAGRMKSELTFVLDLLRSLSPPPEKETDNIKSWPEELRMLWIALVVTVIEACLEGSGAFRLAVKIAAHLNLVKQWLERNWPREFANFRRWRHSATLLSAG